MQANLTDRCEKDCERHIQYKRINRISNVQTSKITESIAICEPSRANQNAVIDSTFGSNWTLIIKDSIVFPKTFQPDAGIRLVN